MRARGEGVRPNLARPSTVNPQGVFPVPGGFLARGRGKASANAAGLEHPDKPLAEEPGRRVWLWQE